MLMIGKRISELPKELQNFAMEHASRAGYAIQSSYYEKEERLVKSLLMINSGGVVIMMSYLHVKCFLNNWLITSLITFLAGLIFSLILLVCDYYHWKGQLCRFSEDSGKFQNDQSTWDEIRHFSGNKGNNK